MQHRRPSYARLMGVLASLLVVVAIATAQSPAAAQGPNDLRLLTLSTRPDTVSGGDVLVRVELPRDVASNDVRVFLNDQDVTSAFGPAPGGGALLGLVQGLQLGENSLEAQVVDQKGKAKDRRKLTVTNYPITGPIFSGPHETPFFCGTQNFRWLNPASTQTLGPTTDPNCSITTRVDYVYRSTAGTYKVLTSTSAYPADLAQTTTSEGRTVPYIVRVETGTINRAIYQTAILHDPTKEAAPTRRSRLRPPGIVDWSTRSVAAASAGGTSRGAALATAASSKI